MYFFWRWHVEAEPFPSFRDSPDWYDIKLLKANPDNLVTSLSYRAHYDAVVKAFKAVGINAKAKTHVTRGSGTRMAEIGGASEDQIRRLGRWSNSALEGCYLTALPREAMRSLAGFPPGSSYYLPRAAVLPEEALLEKVFPDVDRWLQAQETGVGCKQTIAAGKFFCIHYQL